MQNNAATIYFESIDDARGAREALEAQGITARLDHAGEHAQPGGFMERLREFFGAESTADDRRSSGALLNVDAATPEAMEIIRDYGGHVQGSTSSTSDDRGMDRDEERLRVNEERLSIEKQSVHDGEFRAHKEVVTEHQRIDVPVMHEEIYVERRPVSDRTHAEGIDDSGEIRIPVTHEEVRIEKQPVTTEEIVVGKRRVQETQTVGADVRKERVRFDSDVDVDSDNVSDSIDRR